jgi:hypothetical protein
MIPAAASRSISKTALVLRRKPADREARGEAGKELANEGWRFESRFTEVLGKGIVGLIRCRRSE